MRMFITLGLLAATALPAAAAMQLGKPAPTKDVWQPAKTPAGGTAWSLLQQTKLNDRKDEATMTIFTKPSFPAAVKALNGKQIKVAGWMMPLDNGVQQKHWVLLGYPPGCPFHMHALPNQFIEIKAAVPFPTNESKVHIVSGTLQLTGYDESGIFYRLINARPA
ncbi:hypothetical protein J2W40_001628 [Sphingobium xenophagum]|uniref:DUF3299 domain-containing protein n=1 Tax=Sphingobium xenophagum TaxID=121428 RepID=A0ABU1WZS8_SPHXE|nr:DUF3299 domain-containing protein [Sphingobium xenophagum]MDR7154813.1 hypothetical protein [Sphingobium xenophagum]